MAQELFEGSAGAPTGWTHHTSNSLVRDGSGLGVNTSGGSQVLSTYDGAATSIVQRAKFQINTAIPSGGNDYTGVALRGSNGGSGLTCFTVEANSDSTGQLNLNIFVDNVYNSTPHVWAKGSAWAPGDEIEVTVTDDAQPVFEAFVNDVSLGTYTHTGTNYTGLLVGVSIFSGTAQDTDTGLRYWEGGDVVSATVEQEGFQIRLDDGSETTATNAAAQDTSVSIPVAEVRRLRFLLNATEDPAAVQYQLEYRLTGGTYAKVLTSQPIESIPTHVGKGTFTSGTGALLVPAPAGIQNGDLLLLFVESANQVIATPTGYTELTNSPQSTGTAATAGAVRLAVFQKITNGTETEVTVADTGNHQAAQIHAFRGINPTTPVHLTAGAVDAAATADLSAPGLTTTIPNCLIVNVIGLDKDLADVDTLSAVANANLSDVTEQHDQTIAAGVGGGLAVITGGKAVAGATGNTTATGDTATTHAYLTIALAPVTVVAQPVLLATSPNIGASGEATTALMTPPSGKTTGDFIAGRIQDDENPTDSIDLGTNQYTEVEWPVQFVETEVTNNEVYQFRVTRNGSVLDTYTVTPELTVQTSGDIQVPLGVIDARALFQSFPTRVPLGVIDARADFGDVLGRGVILDVIDARASFQSFGNDISGNGTGTIPVITGSGTAEVVVTGTGTGSIPVVTGAGDAESLIQSSAAAVLPVLTGAGDADVLIQGDGSGTVPVLTGAGTAGSEGGGAGAGTIPTLTGSGEGSVIVGGSASTPVPVPVGSSDGSVLVQGTGSGTIPVLTGSGSADSEGGATAAGTIPVLTGSGEANVLVQGDGVGVAPVLTGAGETDVVIQGSGSGSSPILTGSGQGGSLASIMDGAGTIPVLSGSGVGAVLVQSDGSGEIPSLIGSGNTDVVVQGDGAGTIPQLLGQGGAELSTSVGDGAGSIPALTGVGSGGVLVVAEASGTLPSLQSSGTVWVIVQTQGSGSIPVLTGEGRIRDVALGYITVDKIDIVPAIQAYRVDIVPG